jgi:hypothetical protein
MADLSQATIKYGSTAPRFQAKCLEHEAVSNKLMGEQAGLIDIDERFWAFRCKHAGGHIFLANPADGWPRDTADQMYYLNRIQKRELVLPGLQ